VRQSAVGFNLKCVERASIVSGDPMNLPPPFRNDLPDSGKAPPCFRSDLPDRGKAPPCFRNDLPDSGKAPPCFRNDLPDSGKAPPGFRNDLPDRGKAPPGFRNDLPTVEKTTATFCTEILSASHSSLPSPAHTAGSVMMTSSPCGSAHLALTVPPQASTQVLTMASPSPVPPVSRARAVSTR